MFGITCPRYYTRDDGQTFESSNLGSSANVSNGIATNGKMIISVSGANANEYYYSYDGMNWWVGTINAGDPTVNWGAVAYGNGVWVVAPYSDYQYMAVSYDGINWQLSNLLPYSIHYATLCFGEGIFTMAGYGLLWSTDGLTWTNASGSVPVAQQQAYGGGKFIGAVGNDYAVVMETPDGKTWSEVSIPVAGYWNRIAYGNGVFVAIQASGGPSVLSSTDGITWVESSMPNNGDGSGNYEAVTFSGDLFIATNDNSTFAYDCALSSDGVNWTLGGQNLDGGAQWLGYDFAPPTSQMFVLT